MERTASKFFARRQKREQPQQTHMIKPPPLQDYQVDEEDLDKWRVINMQYRALFKKKNDTSQDNRPISPISSDSSPERQIRRKLPKLPKEELIDTKLDQQYLNKKLREIEKKQIPVVEKPNLNDRSVQDLLNSLPKGGTLLEEAEMMISQSKEKVEQGTEQYENMLRSVVEELHIKEIDQKQLIWKRKIDATIAESEKIANKSSDFQALLRKHSMQAQSETEEKQEVNRIAGEIKEVEIKSRLANEENQLLEETINMLKQDIADLSIKFQEREAQLVEELNILHHKLTATENQQVEDLANECKTIEETNQKLEKEIKDVEKMWKGEHENLKEIIEEAEEGYTLLKHELGNIKESKIKLAKERQALQAKKAKLQRQKLEFHRRDKETKTNSFVEAKNKQALILHLDALANEASRKIIDSYYGRDTAIEPENLLKKAMSQLFIQPKSLDFVNPECKALRDIITSLKNQHDKNLGDLEKDKTKSITNLASKLQDIKRDSRTLSKSVASFSNLSPIRSVSPVRENSLLSISKFKEIASKVSSRPSSIMLDGSFDKGSLFSRVSSPKRSEDPEIQRRKLEHKLYLDRSRSGF